MKKQADIHWDPMSTRRYRPPSQLSFAREGLVGFEFGAFLAAERLVATKPASDEHPVLVLPGFTASDRSTQPLRRALKRKGFGAHGWGLGPNVGPHPHVIAGMERRMDELRERYGRKVSIIGWSLGGIYARELARSRPDQVRSVITLGSPYRFRQGDHGNSSELYGVVAPQHDPFDGRALTEEDRPPVPVPTTSIYTMTDGVVNWHSCIDSERPQSENIAVMGTHSGLGVNIATLIAIADRLAQPEGEWKPFRPSVVTRHLFPAATWWRPRE